jgi:hypothetical protein
MKYVPIRTFITGISLLFTAQFAFGADDQSLISQLQKVRDQLATAAGKSAECKTPEAANCNFQDYCQQFDGKGKDFYLYQNAEGRRVTNFHLMENLSAAETCLGKKFTQAPVQDPFAYPEQLIDPVKAGGPQKLLENYQRYLKEIKRTEKIFSDVQDRMVHLLESRRTKENSKAIDNMLARITTVTISTADANDLISPAAKGCDIPNAGYNPLEHKITVCPQLMNLPDATLFSILAHELTHPIDPCIMSMSYSKNGRVISLNDVDFRTEEPTPQDPFFTAIKTTANPFKNTISCLQRSDSMGVQIPAMESVIASRIEETKFTIATKEEVAAYQNPADTDATDFLRAQLDKKVAGIRTHYPEFKQCYNLSGSGHMTEGFADWMASQILKQKISDIPDSGKAKTYAAESQMHLMAISCQNVAQSAAAVVRPLIKGKCSDEGMDTNGVLETDTHPASSKRVSRIMYAPPEVQKALGCKKAADLIECK